MIQKYKHIGITIAVAVVTACIGYIAFSVFSGDISRTQTEDTKQRQKELVAIASHEIEKYFYDIQKRMETIAAMPDVRDAQRRESCNAKLQEMVEINNKELNNLGRVSKDGTFICAVNRTIIGEPVSKYGNYFQKIAKDPKHRPSMSRLIFPSGSASPVVAVHVPVYDSRGNFNGTIGGAVYFDELQRRILAGSGMSKDNLMTLYDENLDILYSPDPLISGKNLSSPDIKRLYTPEGAINEFTESVKKGAGAGETNYNVRSTPYYVAHKATRTIDRKWTVAIGVPATALKESKVSNTSKGIFIGMILTVTVLAVLVTYLAQHRKAARK